MISGQRDRRAYTLFEVTLVVGLLVVLSAMVIPSFLREITREELPGSARQLRSLLNLVGANAAFDGKRYRIRFPREDELDPIGGDRQPIIEREDDPIREPEVFNLVTAPWAVGKTLLGDVWCAEVRLGRPTILELQDLRRGRDETDIQDVVEEALDREDFDPRFPPLYVDPDGTTEWAVFVVTNAPRDTELEEIDDYPRVELILEGATGLAWLQRPFYDEELDLFEEKGWPAVLRQDFLDARVLTEDDVLELRDVPRPGRTERDFESATDAIEPGDAEGTRDGQSGG
jgi:type II secretory pathway pseudopilin PulG